MSPRRALALVCSPCLASSCTRCAAQTTAGSMPGLWESCGFPSALGPSQQAFLWDLQQAWPWGTCRVPGSCSTRRNPSQEVPMAEGSAPPAVGSRGECVMHTGCCQQHTGFAGPLACPPCSLQVCWAGGAHLHTQPCRGMRVFHQGWLLSRSSQRFKLSGCRSLGTASQNIPK